MAFEPLCTYCLNKLLLGLVVNSSHTCKAVSICGSDNHMDISKHGNGCLRNSVDNLLNSFKRYIFFYCKW